MRRMIGRAMMAAPIVGLFLLIGAERGWGELFIALGLIAGFFAWIWIAHWLVND